MAVSSCIFLISWCRLQITHDGLVPFNVSGLALRDLQVWTLKSGTGFQLESYNVLAGFAILCLVKPTRQSQNLRYAQQIAAARKVRYFSGNTHKKIENKSFIATAKAVATTVFTVISILRIPNLAFLSKTGVSYDRMLQALQTATAPETLSLCPIIRGLVIDSLMPTLGRISEIDRMGGVRPGIGDSVLPPGFSPPGERFFPPRSMEACISHLLSKSSLVLKFSADSSAPGVRLVLPRFPCFYLAADPVKII